MAKIQYPPQGGEKRLCLTRFCTMLLSIISAVSIIYSIVIIYVPSVRELQVRFFRVFLDSENAGQSAQLIERVHTHLFELYLCKKPSLKVQGKLSYSDYQDYRAHSHFPR